MTKTYHLCSRCEVEEIGSKTMLPDDWQYSNHLKILCGDCAKFAAALPPTESGRTHDSTSAVDDAPVDFSAKRGGKAFRKMSLWEGTLIFATDKGVTESRVIISANNMVAAIATIMSSVDPFRLDEAVSLVVTPAPAATEMDVLALVPVSDSEKIAA